MSAVLINWAVCLFFLGALVATATLRKVIIAVDRRSYAYIAIGISLLSVAALIRVFNSAGVISAAVLVGEPLFYDLLTTIILITGLTFAVSGMSSWLMIRKRAYANCALDIRRLETIKLVEQLAQLENRIDTIITAALELIVSDYDFESGVGIKCSYRTGAVRVVGSFGEPGLDPAVLSKARLNRDMWHAHYDLETVQVCNLLSIPRGSVKASFSVPIVVDGIPVGMFLLREKIGVTVSRQSRQNIRIVADIIARRVELDRRQLCVAFHEETAQFQSDVETALLDTSDVRSSVTMLADTIRNHVTADIVSLVEFDGGDRHFTRYTSSASGNLVEFKVPIPGETTLSGYLYQTRKSVVITDIRGTALVAADGPVAVDSVRSILALPIVAGDDCLGALILAGERPQEYGSRHESLIQQIIPVLARHLRSMQQARATEIRLQKFDRQWSLMAAVGSLASDEWLRAATGSLTNMAGADCVRVATLEDDGQFMRSRAFSHKTDSIQAAPENGLLVLSVLDCHRNAIESARPWDGIDGDADRSITRLEINQVVGEHCAGVRIIPLIAHNQVVGTLTLGYTAAEIPSLSATEETALGAMTSQIALMIAGTTTARPTGNRFRGLDRAVAANRSERDLRNRLRSPLTGILGSLEMLRAQKDIPEVERYLAIMDKSARRMQEYLEPQETTTGR
ncbi:MAG: GAF domain-containing protein [candidate division Zixibacteria bacterium]|nr:GAF domain-containing protein [candidate division Zixibacteria bacterium]